MTTPDPLGGLVLPYSVVLHPRSSGGYDLFVTEGMRFPEGKGHMQVGNQFWGVPIPVGNSEIQVTWEGLTNIVVRLYRGDTWWNMTTLYGKGAAGVPENIGNLSMSSTQPGDHLRFIFTGGFPTEKEVNTPYFATVNVYPIAPFAP